MQYQKDTFDGVSSAAFKGWWTFLKLGLPCELPPSHDLGLIGPTLEVWTLPVISMRDFPMLPRSSCIIKVMSALRLPGKQDA